MALKSGKNNYFFPICVPSGQNEKNCVNTNKGKIALRTI